MPPWLFNVLSLMVLFTSTVHAVGGSGGGNGNPLTDGLGWAFEDGEFSVSFKRPEYRPQPDEVAEGMLYWDKYFNDVYLICIEQFLFHQPRRQYRKLVWEVMEDRCFNAARFVTVNRPGADGQVTRDTLDGQHFIRRERRHKKLAKIRGQIQLKNWPDWRAEMRHPPPTPENNDEPDPEGDGDGRRNKGNGDGNNLNFDLRRSAEGLWNGGATRQLRQIPSVSQMVAGVTTRLQQGLQMAGPGLTWQVGNVGRQLQTGLQAGKVPRPMVH
ncbi:MAG: hypothetical protein M1823_002763 [Watsoniomyces obsoletus]|nr:MAG: hypothetical protein M1823_002763 [Watsoniomyces obsoletus]